MELALKVPRSANSYLCVLKSTQDDAIQILLALMNSQFIFIHLRFTVLFDFYLPYLVVFALFFLYFSFALSLIILPAWNLDCIIKSCQVVLIFLFFFIAILMIRSYLKTVSTPRLQIIIIILIVLDLQYSVFLWLCLIFDRIFNSTRTLFHAYTPLKEHLVSL